MSFTPTEEQSAVINFGKNSKESLLVNALAGAAKTTTLVLTAHAMKLQPTLCCAFNKRIADEMQKRMPGYITCSTMNSLGHRAWGSHIGKRLTVSTDKAYNALSDLVKDLRPEDRGQAGEAFASMLRTMRFAKSSGYIPKKFEHLGKPLIDQEEFSELASAASDVEPDSLFWKLVDEALCRGIAEGFQGVIDFDDQIYLSTLFGASYAKYPVVMVDEAQDLSPLNHKAIELMFGGRLIAVGDPNQAIYGFRGAHTSSMPVMKKTFSMEELTLSTSFRCPKAVVRLAQIRAPNMKSPEWAIEGKVEHLSSWDAQTPPDGSVIICRNNSPLFRAAMHFIRNGRGVKIVGNDIGAGLLKILKKLGQGSISREETISVIETWRKEQLAKASHSRVGPIKDRAECLLVFAEQGKTLSEAIAFAEHLFSASGPVQFMTGHKAKGLEFPTVFYLDSFLIPTKYSRTQAEFGNPSPLEQERNLNYVIITRAQQELFYVRSEDLV